MTTNNEMLLHDLEHLVTLESKTGNLPGLHACAAALVEIGNRLLAPHATATTINTDEGEILCWRFGSAPPRVALVGHYDTVFPTGTIAEFPFSINNDVLRGPGTFDMKAGLLVALNGCAQALGRDPTSLDGVIIFCNPDEEDGSKSSRTHLQALVDGGLSAAFVFEGGSENGGVCASRMGGMWVEVTFTGKAAHGSQPSLGANALVALSNYVNQLDAIAISLPHSTITPTTAKSGSAINTVPPAASLVIDTRSTTNEGQQAVLDALSNIETSVHEVVTNINVLHRFAPMAASSSMTLTELMRDVCLTNDLPVPDVGMNTGVTDGNHLSAMGVNVLDGLGPLGGGDHSPEEWTSVASMLERIRLISYLVPAAAQHQSRIRPQTKQ